MGWCGAGCFGVGEEGEGVVCVGFYGGVGGFFVLEMGFRAFGEFGLMS